MAIHFHESNFNGKNDLTGANLTPLSGSLQGKRSSLRNTMLHKYEYCHSNKFTASDAVCEVS